jgi:hypothetical protein
MIEQAATRRQRNRLLEYLLECLKARSPYGKGHWLDVLVVPQQGVYDKCTKKFHCEYADRGVYRKHLQEVPNVTAYWRCNCVGLTGGRTQKAVPDVSEAQGAMDLFCEMGLDIVLRRDRTILEEDALDSVENLIFTLMLTRITFPRVPIGQVVVWPAWSFKTKRFNLAARALGILEQTYICGGYGPEAASDSELAAKGEKDQLAQMLSDNDPLLLGAQWERKRRDRYQGRSYEHRLDHLRPSFPGCFAALDRMRMTGTTPNALSGFQEFFRAEVMAGGGPQF